MRRWKENERRMQSGGSRCLNQRNIFLGIFRCPFQFLFFFSFLVANHHLQIHQVSKVSTSLFFRIIPSYSPVFPIAQFLSQIRPR